MRRSAKCSPTSRPSPRSAKTLTRLRRKKRSRLPSQSLPAKLQVWLPQRQMQHERLLTLAAADQREAMEIRQAERVVAVLRNIINDLVGGSWTILGLLFAVVVLPEGQTQSTMATLFILMTIVWIATGYLRWKE